MGASAKNTLRAMGRSEFDDLDEEECQKILEVIQRDYDLRSAEKERIMREREELEDEQYRAEVLATKSDFNNQCCIRCCNKFGFILNRKKTCGVCKFNMCSSCTVPDKKANLDLCKICFQQRQMSLKSCDFFYSGVKQKFTKSGSAKFVKVLQKRRESDLGVPSSYAESEYSEDDAGGLRRRPSLLNLLEQTRQLAEDPPSSRFDTASMGRRCTWGGGLPGATFQAPIKQFETNLNEIIDDVHKLIDDYDMLDDTEVLDPEHYLFRKARRQIYEELLKLSRHISNSMVSDSEDDDDIMQQTNYQSAIRVRRYLVQKVEHITKSNLKHLLPDDDQGVEEWDTESGKRFLEDQLGFVILKKVLEKYTGRCPSVAGSYHGKPVQKIIITEDHGQEHVFDPDYCSTIMPRSSSPTRSSNHSARQRSPSSVSDFNLDHDPSSPSDMTLPSFSSGSNRDANLKFASLMKVNSPMPSLEATKSPIGRLEMDLDDLKSFNKFVYYSDEEPEPEGKVDSDDDLFPERRSSDNFLFKEQGTEELKAWTPADEKVQYIKPPNVAMPHHTDRISPMVGNIIVEDLSDLSDPPSETESDVAASEDERNAEKAKEEDKSDQIDSDENEDDADVLEIPKRRRDSKTKIAVPSDEKSKKRSSVDKDRVSVDKKRLSVDQDRSTVDKDHRASVDQDRSTVDKNHRASVDKDSSFEDAESAIQAKLVTSKTRKSIVECSKTGPDAAKELEPPPQPEPEAPPADKDENETLEAQEDSNTESTTEESDPRILLESKQTSIKRGETLTLSVQLVGTEPLDCFWYFEKDFESCLENDEKYEITKKGSTHSLNIYYCDKQDQGEYLCIGVNEIGQCSRRFKIKVTDNPIKFKAPDFLKRIEDIELVEGKCHRFTVRVTGQPPPRVIWYKDTDLLTPGEEYQIERIGNRNFSLSLYSLSLEDDAEYSAVAINAAGRTACSAQLFVESKT